MIDKLEGFNSTFHDGNCLACVISDPKGYWVPSLVHHGSQVDIVMKCISVMSYVKQLEYMQILDIILKNRSIITQRETEE